MSHRSFADLPKRQAKRAVNSTLCRRPVLMALAALAAAGGCAKFDLNRSIPWGAGENGQLERPVRLVAMWTDTILTTPDAEPTRGFGGRLMFYAHEGSKPAKVKGSLTIYAFDETGRDAKNTKPDRKYVFTEEQFARHYSKSALGHSYSFWLPWDAVGGPQKEISLLVRFQPTSGGVVIGEQSTHLLKGVEPAAVQARSVQPPAGAHPARLPGDSPQPAHSPHAVQTVAYEAPVGQSAAASPYGTAAAHDGQRQRMQTTTLRLPPYQGAAWMAGPSAPPAAAPPGAQSQPAPPSALMPPQAAPAAAAPSTPPQPLTAPAAAEAAQGSTRWPPGRLRAPDGSIARPVRDHAPWRPPHAGWPSDPR